MKEVFVGGGFFFGGKVKLLKGSSGSVDGEVLIDSKEELHYTIKFEFGSVGWSHSRGTFHDKVNGFCRGLRQANELVVDHD